MSPLLRDRFFELREVSYAIQIEGAASIHVGTSPTDRRALDQEVWLRGQILARAKAQEEAMNLTTLLVIILIVILVLLLLGYR